MTILHAFAEGRTVVPAGLKDLEEILSSNLVIPRRTGAR